MKKRRTDHGAAAVEFALVLPLLIAFIFGVFEASRLMEAQSAVVAAARAGAREAALSGSTTATTTAAALSALTAAGISTTGITPVLSPSNPATATANASVSVTVTVPFSSVSWVGLYFKTSKLTAMSTLRKED